MPIQVFFTDLRTTPSKLTKLSIDWEPNVTALQAVTKTLGNTLATEIENDLKNNSHELIVSWHNTQTDDHSEIGGVGTLDWQIPDHTILTISYENENTTQAQIDESIEWTLSNE